MRRAEFATRVGSLVFAAALFLLVALLLATALAGCGNVRSRGAGADRAESPGGGGVAANLPEARELKPPVIHGIKLDPPFKEMDGWYMVAGTVTFTADVTGAERVEFHFHPRAPGLRWS